MVATYTYWTVRYVPDVVRDERVNIAVIVGRDGADWAVRCAPDLRRASRLGGDATELRAWLGSLEESIATHQAPPLDLYGGAHHDRVSSAWVEMLAHRFNNILQVSEQAPVLGESAREAAGFLYDALVSVPEPARRSRSRTAIARDLTTLLTQTAGLELGRNLWRTPTARVGRQRGRFEHAVVNHDVHQLTQVFAFDVLDVAPLEREVQSWNFIVSRLREHGADFAYGRLTAHAGSDAPIAVAYQEPAARRRDAEHLDTMDAALEAWRELNVTPVPSTDLMSIARGSAQYVSAGPQLNADSLDSAR